MFSCFKIVLNYMHGPCGLHFLIYLVPSFFQKSMNGSYGLHFVTCLVPNLDMLKPQDLLTKY
ncbi:hypothetical protein Hanom_Chr14g01322931 [Helianthus anomalus]